MNAPVRLRVENLTKRYGGLIAVKNVSLELRAGEILGLIGPNGSGKSTVMKLMMGIEPVSGGTIKLGDADVTQWPSHRVARAGCAGARCRRGQDHCLVPRASVSRISGKWGRA